MEREDLPGGSLVLGELIDKYGSELDYDLWSAGIDLNEVLAGNTTFGPARLLSFIDQLPEGCATRAAISGGPEYRDWNVVTHILASIYDAQNTNTIVTGNWKKKAPKIEPFPRPGMKPKKKPEPPADPVAAFRNLHSMFMGQVDAGHAQVI